MHGPAKVKSIEDIHVLLKSEKNGGTLHKNLSAFMLISR
jgi:hypothetical protein